MGFDTPSIDPSSLSFDFSVAEEQPALDLPPDLPPLDFSSPLPEAPDFAAQPIPFPDEALAAPEPEATPEPAPLFGETRARPEDLLKDPKTKVSFGEALKLPDDVSPESLALPDQIKPFTIAPDAKFVAQPAPDYFQSLVTQPRSAPAQTAAQEKPAQPVRAASTATPASQAKPAPQVHKPKAPAATAGQAPSKTARSVPAAAPRDPKPAVKSIPQVATFSLGKPLPLAALPKPTTNLPPKAHALSTARPKPPADNLFKSALSNVPKAFDQLGALLSGGMHSAKAAQPKPSLRGYDVTETMHPKAKATSTSNAGASATGKEPGKPTLVSRAIKNLGADLKVQEFSMAPALAKARTADRGDELSKLASKGQPLPTVQPPIFSSKKEYVSGGVSKEYALRSAQNHKYAGRTDGNAVSSVFSAAKGALIDAPLQATEDTLRGATRYAIKPFASLGNEAHEYGKAFFGKQSVAQASKNTKAFDQQVRKQDAHDDAQRFLDRAKQSTEIQLESADNSKRVFAIGQVLLPAFQAFGKVPGTSLKLGSSGAASETKRIPTDIEKAVANLEQATADLAQGKPGAKRAFDTANDEATYSFTEQRKQLTPEQKKAYRTAANTADKSASDYAAAARAAESSATTPAVEPSNTVQTRAAPRDTASTKRETSIYSAAAEGPSQPKASALKTPAEQVEPVTQIQPKTSGTAASAPREPAPYAATPEQPAQPKVSLSKQASAAVQTPTPTSAGRASSRAPADRPEELTSKDAGVRLYDELPQRQPVTNAISTFKRPDTASPTPLGARAGQPSASGGRGDEQGVLPSEKTARDQELERMLGEQSHGTVADLRPPQGRTATLGSPADGARADSKGASPSDNAQARYTGQEPVLRNQSGGTVADQRSLQSQQTATQTQANPPNPGRAPDPSPDDVAVTGGTPGKQNSRSPVYVRATPVRRDTPTLTRSFNLNVNPSLRRTLDSAMSGDIDLGRFPASTGSRTVATMKASVSAVLRRAGIDSADREAAANAAINVARELGVSPTRLAQELVTRTGAAKTNIASTGPQNPLLVDAKQKLESGREGRQTLGDLLSEGTRTAATVFPIDSGSGIYDVKQDSQFKLTEIQSDIDGVFSPSYGLDGKEYIVKNSNGSKSDLYIEFDEPTKAIPGEILGISSGGARPHAIIEVVKDGITSSIQVPLRPDQAVAILNAKSIEQGPAVANLSARRFSQPALDALKFVSDSNKDGSIQNLGVIFNDVTLNTLGSLGANAAGNNAVELGRSFRRSFETGVTTNRETVDTRKLNINDAGLPGMHGIKVYSGGSHLTIGKNPPAPFGLEPDQVAATRTAVNSLPGEVDRLSSKYKLSDDARRDWQTANFYNLDTPSIILPAKVISEFKNRVSEPGYGLPQLQEEIEIILQKKVRDLGLGDFIEIHHSSSDVGDTVKYAEPDAKSGRQIGEGSFTTEWQLIAKARKALPVLDTLSSSLKKYQNIDLIGDLADRGYTYKELRKKSLGDTLTFLKETVRPLLLEKYGPNILGKVITGVDTLYGNADGSPGGSDSSLTLALEALYDKVTVAQTDTGGGRVLEGRGQPYFELVTNRDGSLAVGRPSVDPAQPSAPGAYFTTSHDFATALNRALRDQRPLTQEEVAEFKLVNGKRTER
jgi:hypothetical protein